MRVAEKSGLLRRAAIFLAHSGDSWFWGLGLVVVWWLGDDFWKREAFWLFAGIAVTAVIAQTLKWLFGRQRPPGEWGAIYRSADPHSFPSGHAARMAMLTHRGKTAQASGSLGGHRNPLRPPWEGASARHGCRPVRDSPRRRQGHLEP